MFSYFLGWRGLPDIYPFFRLFTTLSKHKPIKFSNHTQHLLNFMSCKEGVSSPPHPPQHRTNRFNFALGTISFTRKTCHKMFGNALYTTQIARAGRSRNHHLQPVRQTICGRIEQSQEIMGNDRGTSTRTH